MLNQKIFYFFNSFAGRNNILDSLFVFLANDLPWAIIAFVFIYFVFIRKSPRRFFIVSLIVGTSALFTEFLKWIVFKHPRPFAALPDVVQLIQINPLGSFPSQHATIFASLATAVFLYDRKVGGWLLVLTFIIGLCRIVAGIHYPFDILTGFVLGFAITFLAYRLYKKLLKSLKDYFS